MRIRPAWGYRNDTEMQHTRITINMSMQFFSVPEISGTARLDFPDALVGIRNVLCSTCSFLQNALVLRYATPVVMGIPQSILCLFSAKKLLVGLNLLILAVSSSDF